MPFRTRTIPKPLAFIYSQAQKNLCEKLGLYENRFQSCQWKCGAGRQIWRMNSSENFLVFKEGFDWQTRRYNRDPQPFEFWPFCAGISLSKNLLHKDNFEKRLRRKNSSLIGWQIPLRRTALRLEKEIQMLTMHKHKTACAAHGFVRSFFG